MSSAPLSPQVLDELALAAYAAVIRDNLDKTQVNKLIEVLELTRNVDFLLAHIARQVGRAKEEVKRRKDVPWGLSHYSAFKLYQLLKGRNLSEARIILGIFKWLFEAGANNQGKSRLRQLRNVNLRAKAPQGFYHRYLSIVLSP